MNERKRTVSELRNALRSLEWQRDDLEQEVASLEEELYKAERECPNCGEQAQVAGEPCSRVCRLQLEWADELKARQAATDRVAR